MSNLYYRGDSIFLYVQFTDQNGNITSAQNPKVRILHDKNGTIYEDLSWKNLQQMSENEYFYNFQIPYDSDLGQYQIIYLGEVDGNIAHIIETFHVIMHSDIYPNAIKLYGYINDIRTNCVLSDVTVNIYSIENNDLIYQSSSNGDGYWEAFLYPNEYIFSFIKSGFNKLDIQAQVGDEHTEIQFNNIGLESETASLKGNGMYLINDTYVTKQGVPLSGLNVTIANVSNPNNIIAKDTTDKDGNWQCFLDPGMYLMKIIGTTFNKEFNKTFRIKVDQTGQFKFEDLSKNIAVVTQETSIGTGNGSVTVSDEIKDRNGNPIIDVQVNVFKKGAILSDNNIIAQDYTDVQGKWSMQLDPGDYVFEFYHPKFKVFTENRSIK